MAIRLSGLTSGMDTDAIVKELVSAYSLKTQKYEKASTKLTWKQDAWKNLNTKIYGLYTNVSNLRFSSAYNLRKVSVSDNTKATVTASSDAVTGTQKLNILKTAQASYITGAKLGDNITADSKLSDLGYTQGDTEIAIKKANGEQTAIKVTKDTTIKDLVNQMKEAGYNANFDANNKRLFVSAKESGAAADFDIIAKDDMGKSVISALGLGTAMVELDENGKKIFTSAASNYEEAYKMLEKAKAEGFDDLESYIRDQLSKHDDLEEQLKNDKFDALSKKTKRAQAQVQLNTLKAQKDARTAHNDIYADLKAAGLTVSNGEKLTSAQLRDMIDKVYDGADFSEENIANLATYMEENQIALADGYDNYTDYAKAVQDVLAENKDHVKTIDNYMDNKDVDDLPNYLSLPIDEITVKLEEAQLSYDEAVAAEKAADENVKATEKALEEHPYASFYEEGKTEETREAEIAELVKRADEAQAILDDAASMESQAVKIKGQDAEILLNGVEYTSSSNSFSINGLTINAQAVTGEGAENAISISTSIDTQGIYDKVKDFLTEYNNVINEMTKLYNADSAGDYEPLTDEEKEAMSDEQIEKWENKIKDSLLRRDTTLNSMMSVMVNSMAQTIEIDGQKLSLSTFGIQTLGFLNSPKNENYAYHIDGDPDDENASGKKDKLMAAIEENPEQVEEFMKQLAGNLYKAIDNKMKSTELSSAYKVYNDKEMDRELKDYAEAIKKWEDKVTDKEDYYFKQFSQMEVALSKLQNQTSSISGLFNM